MQRRGAPGRREFETRIRVRGYELDGFGHVNHAVYFNYFEVARYDAMLAGGLPLEELTARGWGVHLVHAEADFKREAFLGQEIMVTTKVVAARSSSMTIEHVAMDPDRPETVFAKGRVEAVWIGPDKRPMRIPPEVRKALGFD